MKRSFYDMFGVPRDATQEQIDAAYKHATAKLNATNVRGAAQATMEAQLITDGYQILSDPVQRAKYDAKLAASTSGVQLMFFPEGRAVQQKLGVEIMIFAALVTVLGGVIYYQLSHRMDAVRVEHVQAVIRHKEEQEKVKVITVDTAQPPATISVVPAREEKR